jgi:tetratricopeptide (TPR) repeat protein
MDCSATTTTTSTRLFLDQAVKLTNEGTSLLVFGQEDRAINEFTTALEIMAKSGLSDRHPNRAPAPQDSQQRAYSFDANASSSLAGKSAEHPPRYASPVRLPNPPAATGGDHSSFFVYRHALKVNISGGMDSAKDMDIVISAIIIFNMALLYHLKGIRENTASKYHAKSMRLYNMSLELLKNLDNNSSHHEDVVLLQVACWNNMSHISYEQADFDRALLQLSELQWLLCMMAVRPNHFTADDMQRFMLNGMLLRALSTAPAA